MTQAVATKPGQLSTASSQPARRAADRDDIKDNHKQAKHRETKIVRLDIVDLAAPDEDY